MKNGVKLVAMVAALVLMVGCDTEKEGGAPASKFKLTDLQHSWKLITGSTKVATLVIPDIFDKNNPLISGNPEAMAALCNKGNILQLKSDMTFGEKSDCYQGKTEEGTYTFNEKEGTFEVKYKNLQTPSRLYVIKSLNASQLVVEYSGTNSTGIPFTSTITYNKN
ncbi:MAG: lipocalin family protein [Flammeovirgaceae bacterium]|nr:lipocalin family protein [Flammeovirgaceae bacterium]